MVVAVTAACDGSAGAPVAEPDPEAVGAAVETLLDVGLATALAGSYFDFGVTFDLGLADTDLAARAGATIERNLAGCGHVTVTGLEVAVDFGTAPGCRLATGIEVAGTISAQVSKLCCFQGAGFVLVSLPLDGVSVDGHALAGTYTIRTPDPARIALTAAGTGMEGIVDIVGSTETLALSSPITTARTTPPTRLELHSVVWRRGDCYPSAGSIQVERDTSSQTLSFTTTTATTGTATLTTGPTPSDLPLPPYGPCP